MNMKNENRFLFVFTNWKNLRIRKIVLLKIIIKISNENKRLPQIHPQKEKNLSI